MVRTCLPFPYDNFLGSALIGLNVRRTHRKLGEYHSIRLGEWVSIKQHFLNRLRYHGVSSSHSYRRSPSWRSLHLFVDFFALSRAWKGWRFSPIFCSYIPVPAHHSPGCMRNSCSQNHRRRKYSVSISSAGGRALPNLSESCLPCFFPLRKLRSTLYHGSLYCMYIHLSLLRSSTCPLSISLASLHQRWNIWYI